MEQESFCHSSTGTLLYDPGQGTAQFEPWWALLMCDQGILDYHAWLLLRHGIDLHKGSRWGPHICFVRGEVPADPSTWGFDPGPVTFSYANQIRWDNGRHAWLDVWCPALTDIRARLGLKTKPRTLFHLTIGRLVVPREASPQVYQTEDTLIL